MPEIDLSPDDYEPAGKRQEIDLSPDEFEPATKMSDVGPFAEGYKAPKGPDFRVPEAPKKQYSKTETAIMHGAQGATGGFLEELMAALVASGTGGGNPMFPNPERVAEASKRQREAGGFLPVYREERDAYRAEMKESAEQNPKTALAASIAGSVATPLKIPGKGGGIPGAVARAAGEGAVFGAGHSEADLTKGEGSKFVEDVAKSGALSAAVAGGGRLAAEGVKKVGAAVTEGLRRRVLNEIIEGGGLEKATPRAATKLEKVGDLVMEEVIDGKHGKAIRTAWNKSGQEGLKAIKPAIEEVGARKDAIYAQFEAAGRGRPNLQAYVKGLQQAAKEFRDEGQAKMADVVDGYIDDVREFVTKAGGSINLRQLRGLTTQTGKAADAAMGQTIEPALGTALKSRLKSVATEAMDEAVEGAAEGVPALQKAAIELKAVNRSMRALLTVQETLGQRAAKEGRGRSLLVRGAEKLANPAALVGGGGALAGAMSGNEDEVMDRVLKAAAIMAAARAIPAFARYTDRQITSLAIAAAKGEKAGGLAGLAAKALGPGAERVAKVAGSAAVAEKAREEGFTPPGPLNPGGGGERGAGVVSDEAVVELVRLARSGVGEEEILTRAGALGIPVEAAKNVMKAVGRR